jgi:hypothetical protein
MDVMHGHDLEGFIGFSDAELAIIGEVLRQEVETMDTVGAEDRLIEAEKENSKEDEVANDEPSEPGLLPQVTELCL